MDPPALNKAAPDEQMDENDIILERQNLQLGCDEMQRITDDIIVPVFVRAAKALKRVNQHVEVVLMDCESPIDGTLYNVGVRCRIGQDKENAHRISIIADPSEFDFTFEATDPSGEVEIKQVFSYHEVIPYQLETRLEEFLKKHFPDTNYAAEIDEIDRMTASYEPPFRVQYDEEGNVSDVASTATIAEAIKMGSTFAHMFKSESKISIIDNKGSILC